MVGSYRNYEVWRHDCNPSVGTQEYCNNTTSHSDSTVVTGVSIGDVLKHRLVEVQLEANVLRDVAIAVR